MSTETPKPTQKELTDATGLSDILRRQAAESRHDATQQIKLDSSNKVTFPGNDYSFEALHEQILVSIDLFKSGGDCIFCDGKGQIESKVGRESVYVKCTKCDGSGSTIILLDSSKRLPTHGIVVSMGPRAKELAGYTIGDRVLFGEHSGTAIATKSSLMFKYMDWYQAKLKIGGADALNAFDFLIERE